MVHKDEKGEFSKFQLQEVFTTYRTQYTLLIQIMTVLLVADVTVIGYSIHEKMCGVIFIGVVFPIMMMLVRRTIRRSMIPILFTGLTLENKYGSPDNDWLISTYLNFNHGSSFVQLLLEINTLKTKEEKIQQLKFVHSQSYTKLKNPLFIILLSIVIGHIVGPIILHHYFRLPYF